MKCSLCGSQFEEEDARKECRGCSLFGGCRKIRCPHCGYETPREIWPVTFFRRRQAGRSKPGQSRPRETQRDAPPDVLPLSEAKAGAEGVVVCLNTHKGQDLKKLMAFGILPGVRIRLLRRFPAFVFRLGYSRFAVDRSLAEKIQIRLQKCGRG